MRCRYWLIGIVVLIGLTPAAPAETVVSDLLFEAHDQSLWGPGSSGGGWSDSGGIGGSIGIRWDVGADAGTVSSTVSGDLHIAYPREAARRAIINLAFSGDPNGGRVTSDLGAWIDIDGRVRVNMPWPIPDIRADWGIYSQDYALRIDETFTPVLGSHVHGDDRFTATRVGVGTSGIGAWVNFEMEQTLDLAPTALLGYLDCTHRGTGLSFATPFTLSGDGATVALDLPRNGLWDCHVRDVHLANRFDTEFDMAMTARIDYAVGSWRRDLLRAGLYDGDAFELGYRPVRDAGRFTIEVVPEPATALLVAAGLAGLAIFRVR
jgi:hypothetical protein